MFLAYFNDKVSENQNVKTRAFCWGVYMYIGGYYNIFLYTLLYTCTLL